MTSKDERKTDKWLKESGINPDDLTKSSLLLLRADKTAQWLKDCDCLNISELAAINNYQHQAQYKKNRSSITNTQAYKVLNIGIKARRQIFKQQRTGK
jgi:phosphohistidine phosphatase SixA